MLGVRTSIDETASRVQLRIHHLEPKAGMSLSFPSRMATVPNPILAAAEEQDVPEEGRAHQRDLVSLVHGVDSFEECRAGGSVDATGTNLGTFEAVPGSLATASFLAQSLFVWLRRDWPRLGRIPLRRSMCAQELVGRGTHAKLFELILADVKRLSRMTRRIWAGGRREPEPHGTRRVNCRLREVWLNASAQFAG